MMFPLFLASLAAQVAANSPEVARAGDLLAAWQICLVDQYNGRHADPADVATVVDEAFVRCAAGETALRNQIASFSSPRAADTFLAELRPQKRDELLAAAAESRRLRAQRDRPQ